MQFPDIEATDLTPDEHRLWLTTLLTAMADRVDPLMAALSDEDAEAMLYYLVTMLTEATEANGFSGETWQQFLRLA